MRTLVEEPSLPTLTHRDDIGPWTATQSDGTVHIVGFGGRIGGAIEEHGHHCAQHVGPGEAAGTTDSLLYLIALNVVFDVVQRNLLRGIWLDGELAAAALGAIDGRL